MAGRGLLWLGEDRVSSNWPFCFTFVRGRTEQEVFAAFGADPGQAVPHRWRDLGSVQASSLVQVGRSGQWLYTRQDHYGRPPSFRPELCRRLSAGGAEAVALYHDIGKLNHELVHAFDGEVVTAVTTSVPPHWSGSDPDRLRPLAEELWELDYLDWEVLLAIAEAVFELSLEPDDLDLAWPTAPIAE